MIYVKWFLLAMLNLIFTIICWLFINWWAPIFADAGGNLPAWLKWVGTFDANLDAGHDAGFFPTITNRYLWRVAWLYRNPAAGFGYWLLGIPFDESTWSVIKYVPPVPGSGELFMKSSSGYFCWRGKRLGLTFYLGWKADHMRNDDGTWSSSNWGPQRRVPIAFVIECKKG